MFTIKNCFSHSSMSFLFDNRKNTSTIVYNSTFLQVLKLKKKEVFFFYNPAIRIETNRIVYIVRGTKKVLEDSFFVLC